VKPLERVQLKNWYDYLEFEVGEKKRKRIITLFERCMISCAMYDEMWIKVNFLQENGAHKSFFEIKKGYFELIFERKK
jgi:pre-mRNA-processing factor 39